MEQIRKITLSGYRLFKEERSIEFNESRPGGLGLNIIVGPNNVGKSSIVSLLGGGYYNQINREDWSEAAGPRVLIESSTGKSSDIQYLRNSPTPSVKMNPEGQGFNLQTLYLPSDRRWAFEASNVYLGTVNIHSPNPTPEQQTEGLVQVTQSTSYAFASNQNYEEVRKPNEPFIAVLLFISQYASLMEKYGVLVREFIPNFQSYDLLRRRGNKYQVLYRTLDSREQIDMSLVGDGVLTIMVICAYLLMLRESNGGMGSPSVPRVLVIDEPEAALHPQAQKKLYGYIKEIAQSYQVIYATHSPYLISWDIVVAGGRIMRVDSEDGKQASVYALDASNNSQIKFPSSKRRRSNLDIISREIVFSDRVLIVEGLDDANILRSYIEGEGLACDFEICGHGADGANNIANWMRVAKALNIKAAAIFDLDPMHPERVIDARKEFGDEAIKEWSTEDIRDKSEFGDTPSVTGLFDAEGSIKGLKEKAEVDTVLRGVGEYLGS